MQLLERQKPTQTWPLIRGHPLATQACTHITKHMQTSTMYRKTTYKMHNTKTSDRCTSQLAFACSQARLIDLSVLDALARARALAFSITAASRHMHRAPCDCAQPNALGFHFPHAVAAHCKTCARNRNACSSRCSGVGGGGHVTDCRRRRALRALDG